MDTKNLYLHGYVPSFDPENDPEVELKNHGEWSFDRFIPEGAVFFLPETIPGWKDLKKPVPARFYSAHFCFTLGAFSLEVQHNPEYYFHGEEISIAVRAFTHGYDLFHPHRVLLFGMNTLVRVEPNNGMTIKLGVKKTIHSHHNK
jgi:hypothetical protein